MILKVKNYYRRKYQSSRIPAHYQLYVLYSQLFSTQLSRLRNEKWTSFLRTLHPQFSHFWKTARYFKQSSFSIPPLTHLGTHAFHTPHKVEILARQFEQSHNLITHMGSHTHMQTVSHHVNRFFREKHHTSPNYNLRILTRLNL
jgi:hypothetical protein